MARNSIIEYEVFEIKSFSQQVSTSPNLDPLLRISMQLGHTFPHQVDKKKREEVPSNSFSRGGIEAMIFSRRLALLLKRLFIPHLTCIPITLIVLYIFTNKQFTWNVSDIFQGYWCMCLSQLILSLIIAYPYLTRCVIHNGPTINLILTIDIVWQIGHS